MFDSFMACKSKSIFRTLTLISINDPKHEIERMKQKITFQILFWLRSNMAYCNSFFFGSCNYSSKTLP